MDIGILGSGDVARALAKGFLGRGDRVMMGSRDANDPKTTDWAASAGGQARAGSFADAAAFGQVVVLATKGMVNEAVLQAARPENLAGKLLIDATNPLVFAEGAGPTLGITGDDSGGEQVQRLVPQAKVVKCWNIIGNPFMVRPKMPGGPPTMLIAGNDRDAKGEVRKILVDFGWSDIYDVGGIEASRELESLCMLWVRLYMLRGKGDHAFRVIHG